MSLRICFEIRKSLFVIVAPLEREMSPCHMRGLSNINSPRIDAGGRVNHDGANLIKEDNSRVWPRMGNANRYLLRMIKTTDLNTH